jgi:putative hydrolase of the HAD superfamily
VGLTYDPMVPHDLSHSPMLPADHRVQALVVDWGGVLTGPLTATIEKWAEADGIDLSVYFQVIEAWMGPALALEARMNPIHALERGEMLVPDFESRLAHEMFLRTGVEFAGQGFLQRMFDHFEHAQDMNGLVHRAHSLGVKTALLSNSWGNVYPRDGWDDMFDVVVISGEVGMRKPDADIFQHTVDLLEVPFHQCVFVDDMMVNVQSAVDLGMIGIHHTAYDDTAMELEAIFELPLA